MTDKKHEEYINSCNSILKNFDDLLENKENALYTPTQFKMQIIKQFDKFKFDLNEVEKDNQSEVNQLNESIQWYKKKVSELEDKETDLQESINEVDNLIERLKDSRFEHRIQSISNLCDEIDNAKKQLINQIINL